MLTDPRAYKAGTDPQASPRKSQAIDVSSGDVVVDPVCTALIATSAGDVSVHFVDDPDGTNRTFSIEANKLFIGQFDLVLQSGTTATGILALSP